MKKIILPILLMICSASFAQVCVPGSQTLPFSSYIIPDAATNFNEGCVGEYYEQYVYLKVPKDTTLAPISLTIDSFVISKVVIGLPAGLNVEGVPGILPAAPSNPKTNFERMKVKGDSLACIKISGTIPTSVAVGMYNLEIPIRAYTKVSGIVPLDTAMNLTTYHINIKATGTCYPAAVSNLQKYQFNLLGNSPNPFNGITTIKFESAKTSEFDLKIINSLGSIVYTQTVKSQLGLNYVNFDGTNLSSGMYLIVLSDGQNRITQKMQIN